MDRKVINIKTDATAVFRSRPNRFLGIVDILSPAGYRSNGIEAHIQDPGRLKELLFNGNRVLLKKAESNTRRTGWSLIAAEYDNKWILVNSNYHWAISNWLISNQYVAPFKNIKAITPEVRLGNSRLDYHLETRNGKSIWVEVKGCTLVIDGVALFPDAPTTRGSKHLKELIGARKNGMGAAAIILVLRDDAKCFLPNEKTDPDFTRLFFKAEDAGVVIIPALFSYKNDIVYYRGNIPVCHERTILER